MAGNAQRLAMRRRAAIKLEARKANHPNEVSDDDGVPGTRHVHELWSPGSVPPELDELVSVDEPPLPASPELLELDDELAAPASPPMPFPPVPLPPVPLPPVLFPPVPFPPVPIPPVPIPPVPIPPVPIPPEPTIPPPVPIAPPAPPAPPMPPMPQFGIPP